MSIISMKFIQSVKKSVEKMDNVTMDFSPPSHWYSTR